jgi:hypothetical protein
MKQFQRGNSIDCELHLIKRRSQVQIFPSHTLTWTCKKKKKKKAIMEQKEEKEV